MILAASSPFFQKLLEKNKHPHPLVYMRALKFEDLLALVDFLYVGEANLFQENLDSFLTLAEELQLKGLLGKVDEKAGNVLDGRPENLSTNPVFKNVKHSISVKNDQIKNEATANNMVALSTNLSGNIEDLEENVKSLMEQSSNNYSSGNRSWKGYKCKVCGKEGAGNAIKDHIEANHLEGIVLPCDQCEKTFRCRNNLSKHMRKNHLINK